MLQIYFFDCELHRRKYRNILCEMYIIHIKNIICGEISVILNIFWVYFSWSLLPRPGIDSVNAYRNPSKLSKWFMSAPFAPAAWVERGAPSKQESRWVSDPRGSLAIYLINVISYPSSLLGFTRFRLVSLPLAPAPRPGFGLVSTCLATLSTER